jgi:hypothetical protein
MPPMFSYNPGSSVAIPCVIIPEPDAKSMMAYAVQNIISFGNITAEINAENGKDLKIGNFPIAHCWKFGS